MNILSSVEAEAVFADIEYINTIHKTLSVRNINRLYINQFNLLLNSMKYIAKNPPE